MKNTEKNNKKIIIEKNNNPAEMAESLEIKRKRGRPRKNNNDELINLKNKKNNNKKINNAEAIENKGLEGNQKINKNNKNNIIVSGSGQDENQVKKGRGRPKGTTGITRRDNINSPAFDEVRKKILGFNMVLFHLPKINDYNDLQLVQERTDLFFNLCVQHSVSPTVAGYAFSLGIDRATLWNWINKKTDRIKNQKCFDVIKNAYDFINNNYEQLLTEGKIIPVAGFFLLQNNYGYKQQTDHVITANQENNVTDEDITNKAGLLD